MSTDRENPAPAADAPKKKLSGLSIVGRMRARENARREKRGQPPMKDIPLREGLENAAKLVRRVIDGPPAPPEEDTIEAEAEVVEDDGAHKRMGSGK